MLRENLEQLRAGKTDFARFAASTSADFRRLARYLMRRWSSPSGVGPEDVEQELRLGAWEALVRWKPTGGMPLDRYVTWCAVASAKRWLHGQRAARRRSDRTESRFFLPLSAYGDGEHVPEQAVDPEQEDRIDRVKSVGRVIAGLGPIESAIVLALVDHHGDVDATTVEVYEDPKLRLACRIECERDAAALVRRAAAYARRLATQAA